MPTLTEAQLANLDTVRAAVAALKESAPANAVDEDQDGLNRLAKSLARDLDAFNSSIRQ